MQDRSERQRSMMPADNILDGKNVWMPEYFLTGPTLSGVTFTNCRISGPGVFVFSGQTQMGNCQFPGPFDAFFWELSKERLDVGVLGAFVFEDCSFIGCFFDHSIGFAGSAQFGNQLRSALPPNE